MKKQFLELAALPKPSVNDIAVFDGRDWVARPLPTRSPTIIHKTTLERVGALGHPGGSGYALVSGDSSIDWDLTPLWEGTHTWAGSYEINLRDSALKVYSSVDGQLDIDADGEVELASAYFDIRADIRTDRWLNNDNNVFIGVGVIGSGNLAHTTGDTGYYNTSVGGYSGVAMTTGYDNTFCGFQAGYNVTSGYENTLIGESAGVTLDVGYRNTMVGCMCGQVQQTGYENVFVGYRTGEGRGAISAYRNVAIGVQAGSDLAAGSLNTFVGYQAGLLVQDAQYNVIVGASAGDALVSGGNNILIGFQAGNTLTTGAGNILIGYDVDTAANNTANFLSIGNLIFATGGFGTGTTVGAGNVGIKKNNPAEALDVTGNIGVSGTVDGIDVSAFGAVQFVTLAADAAVANERVLTGTANQVIITDGGAGNAVTLSLPQSIHTAATPTFAGVIATTGTIAAKPADTAGIALDPNAATGNFTLSLSPANLTAARRVTFPDADWTITGGGTFALGGYTLTVPATGTAALLATANVFTAAQTITAAGTQLTLGPDGANYCTIAVSAAGAVTLDAVGASSSFVFSDSVQVSSHFAAGTAGISAVVAAQVIETYTDPGATNFGLSVGNFAALTADSGSIETIGGAMTARLSTGAFTLNGAIGADLTAGSTVSGGTVTLATGFRGRIIALSGGVVTTGQCLYLAPTISGVGSAIGTLYGILLANMAVSGVTTAYGIYTGTGLNRFGDQLSIVGSADRNQLMVTGFTTQADPVAHLIDNTPATAVVREALRLDVRCSTAATGGAAGFGIAHTHYGESATNGNFRQMAQWASLWATATDASRKARSVWSVWDTAEREGMRIEASGSAPMLGFLGATAVARQTGYAVPTDLATCISALTTLRTALINYGLITTV